ncbi:MAG: hypothetical protein K2N95_11725 [Lachnospiraceae bacterium]|nr:hypothetical protein [Lachnospiraceae bacterium]
MMKNKMKIVLLLIAVVCLAAGMYFFTRPKIRLPEHPIVYAQRIHEGEYAYLVYEDKIFVPYCPYEADCLGECIGYYDVPASENTEAGRAYVCEMRGCSKDEWIIDIMDTNCSEGMILREINTTEIPEGLTSEYEWNQ